MTEAIEQNIEEMPATTDIHHLSYSTAKKIYRKGIDYALGTKLGLIEETFGKAADIGVMAHALVLGGEPEWVVSEFDNFRTKAAQEWIAYLIVCNAFSLNKSSMTIRNSFLSSTIASKCWILLYPSAKHSLFVFASMAASTTPAMALVKLISNSNVLICACLAANSPIMLSPHLHLLIQFLLCPR